MAKPSRDSLAVNSRQTDALFEVKHEFQSALYGPEERRGWERWNEHFLSRILDVARDNAGKRIVVTVGVEHGYWLRKRLRRDSRLASLEPEVALP